MNDGRRQSGQIFVIGDSHIGLTNGAERDILGWLERLEAQSPRDLYLNGDLFHYLIAHRKFTTASVENVMRAFRRMRDRGIGVHYVEGNRDFFLKGSFVEDSVTDVAVEYSVSAGANRFLITHGDMLNDRDWPYRFWRKASKNPVTRVGVGLIPGRMARNFVDRIERRLARSNFKHKTSLPLELMKDYTAKRAREGYTHVVLGHFHSKLVIPAVTATLLVLPAWYESGEAMMISPATGDSEFVSL